MDLIETPRLWLLPLSREMLQRRLEADTFALSSTVNGQELTVQFGPEWPGEPLDAFSFFLAQLDALKLDALPGSYAAVERETGRAVGMLGTKGAVSASGEIEIGYGFNPADRGQGYATEAVIHLVHSLLQQPRVETVTALTVLGNRASERVLEKVGFARSSRRWDDKDGAVTIWAVGH